MTKKRFVLLDLFCGAGGAAVGYHAAGFRVLGVDWNPQPRYPFAFVQDDALAVLERLAAGRAWRGWRGDSFDLIHCSPPCQRYSRTARIHPGPEQLPDLAPRCRELLIRTKCNYVIENVPGAPLHFPALVCGLALRLGVKRHRLFESNVLLFGSGCPRGHEDRFVTVAGHGFRERCGGCERRVSVCGGAPKASNSRSATAAMARAAMGIDWMTRGELSQAVPPAYTCFIGRQLVSVLRNQR